MEVRKKSGLDQILREKIRRKEIGREGGYDSDG